MNVDNEYLRMILALPDEFFEGWEWKEGDHAISLRVNEEGIMDDGECVLTSFNVGCFPGDIVNVLFLDNEVDPIYRWSELFCINNLRPIPSQEQLLKIYKTKKDIPYDSLSLLWLANWIEDKVTENHGFCFKYKSAEAMTLLWVQETCYNKTWNGEAWL